MKKEVIMSRLLLTISISLVMLACRAHPRDEETPSCPEASETSWAAPQIADYEVVLEHLENYRESVDNVRPDEYQPAQVLPRLHPWFKQGLCQALYEGQTIYHLQKIPDRLIEDIQAISSNHGPVAFGILNAAFWREIQAAQGAGLTIGFLEFSKGFEVAGVYHRSEKLIGLDLFANRGTIQHEMRHHKQALATPRWGRNWYLENSCTLQTGRFLGELDSTTVQLPFWKETFDGVQIETLLRQGTPARRAYSQAVFFYANLNYPQLAGSWLNNQNCPDELLKAVGDVVQNTNIALINLTGSARKLVGIHSNLTLILQQLNEKCPSDTTSDPICSAMRDRRDRLVKEGQELKIKLNDDIETEALARPKYIRKIFAEMPKWIRKDLERTSGAYRLLMGL